MAPKRKTKTKEDKPNPIPKQKKAKIEKEEEPHIWIYGDPTFDYDDECFEFHPAIQNYVEKAYTSGKKRCSIIVFGTRWLVDFETMKEYKGDSKQALSERMSREIKRIPKSSASTFENLIGIAGLLYPKPDTEETFQQTENRCTVCYFEPSIPTKVDSCGHVFCFLCLKSNYRMGLNCPTCRARISGMNISGRQIRYDVDLHAVCPEEYAADCTRMYDPDSNKLCLNKEPLKRSKRAARPQHYWIYKNEGAVSGWYRYEPKHEKAIEEGFLRKVKVVQLFICGDDQKIDLTIMRQRRLDAYGDVIRSLEIKRIKTTDLSKYEIRGIAGIDCSAYPVELSN